MNAPLIARNEKPVSLVPSILGESAAAIATHIMEFTISNDVAAQTLKYRKGTWPKIVDVLTAPKTHSTKARCPLIKLGTYGDKRTVGRCLRSDDNMLAVHGIEGDYDAGVVTPGDAAARLEHAGVEAFIYTTARHTPETPRWRVLAPLSQSCEPSRRAHFVALLNNALGGILAPESFDLSRMYYFGKVEGVVYETHDVRGIRIDQLGEGLIPQYPGKDGEEVVPIPQAHGNGALERSDLLQGVTEDTILDLRSALTHVDNKDRAMWVNVLQALKNLGTPGYELAKEYSQRDGYPFDEAEFDRVWESAKPKQLDFRWIFNRARERGWLNPRSGTVQQTENSYVTRVDHTDTGNANLLVRLTAGDLRWVAERELWLSWDSNRWIADDHGVMAWAAARRVARHYHDQAAELMLKMGDDALDDSGRKKLQSVIDGLKRWERHCRNKRTIDAMLATAAKDPAVQLSASELDKNPWLLGVENGVVDLRTGKLRPAARDEFVTKRSPVKFNPGAEAPRWVQFIEEITGAAGSFAKRPALASYLQRGLAYSLTGSTAEHKMFVAIGSGANGKNVLLDTFQRVAGGYCCTIPAAALMAVRSDDPERASPIAASLAGARAAISSESKDGQKLDVALVKLHTGGGYMTARFLRENSFRFEITHKLWLMTNHRPALDHMDDAMRGRLHLIPFDRKWNRPGHPDRDPGLPDGDKDLMQTLKDEDEGVLAWLVAGALAYALEGLVPPGEVTSMTRDYFKDQDSLGRWLDAYERCDPKSGGTAQELLDAYLAWCTEECVDTQRGGTMKGFSMAIKGRGYEKFVGSDATRYGLQARGGNRL